MKQKLDKNEELLYKSFELDPLAKMSVEIGKNKTDRVLNTLEYLGSLTLKRDLSWLGYDKKVSPLDPATALFIRDHSVFSNVRRTIDHGVAHQYGKTLIEGVHGQESLIGAASAIALVEKDEADNIKIHRKKQMGLENKHARELVPEFHGVKEMKKKVEKKEEIEDDEPFEPPWDKQDHETQMLKKITEENKPPLKGEENKPPLKKHIEEVEAEDEGYIPPWGE